MNDLESMITTNIRCAGCNSPSRITVFHPVTEVNEELTRWLCPCGHRNRVSVELTVTDLQGKEAAQDETIYSKGG